MGRPPKLNAPASNPYRRVQRYVCVAYTVLLVYLSLAPGQRIPGILDWSDLFSPDKVAHFGAYAIFSVLLSFSIGILPVGKRIGTAVICATLFGVVMEILQGVAGTGREYDPVDMVANLIGALLGGVIYWLLLRLKNRVFATAGPLR